MKSDFIEKREIKIAYDLMSKFYDRGLALTRKIESLEEDCLKEIIGYLKKRILDLGCGTGRYTLRLSYEQSYIVAIDISTGMLSVLKDKTRSVKKDAFIDVINADAERIPVRNNAFDNIICTLAFDHFIDKERVVNECSRVLKREGAFLFSIFNKNLLKFYRKMMDVPEGKVIFRLNKKLRIILYEDSLDLKSVVKIFKERGFQGKMLTGCFPLPASFKKIGFSSRVNMLLNRIFRNYAVLYIFLFIKGGQ